MTNDTTTTLTTGSSYLEWGPILAGAVAAVALSFVLLTAGASIGLSLVSPYPSQSYGKSAATLATAWALCVTIGSFLVGGYIAGRMRKTWSEGNPDEVTFRDGIHGFVVWSLSIFVGGVLASLIGSTTTLVGAHVGRTAQYASERTTILAPSVDALVRGSLSATAPAFTPANADLRDEVARVLVTSLASGQLTPTNRTYLAHFVSYRSGVAAPDAEKRVDEIYAEAGRAIEQSRKAVVLLGLVTTTALLFGLVASWYAARRGGHHRDHNIPARFGYFVSLKVRRE